MPKVTVIPPSINRATRQDISAPTRRKSLPTPEFPPISRNNSPL
ncbi:MAG: hypothetical protein ACLS6W_06025 [Ruminococcus sp.]